MGAILVEKAPIGYGRIPLPAKRGALALKVSLFASKYASGVLNTLKNKGVLENDNGETGPVVMNEYCLLSLEKAE